MHYFYAYGQINGQERPIFGLYKRKLEDFIMLTTGIYINLPGSNIELLQSNLQFTSNFSQNIWY